MGMGMKAYPGIKGFSLSFFSSSILHSIAKPGEDGLRK
jgi:hypothetical protein